MEYLINGLEVDMDNLSDWTTSSLIKFGDQIQNNISRKLGEVAKQKVFLDLIDLEIDRQQRVQRINVGADVKKQKILNKARKNKINIDD